MFITRPEKIFVTHRLGFAGFDPGRFTKKRRSTFRLEGVTMNPAYIYAIMLSVTGDSYVGISMQLKKRWRTHLGFLRKGIHDYPALQAAWTKHGVDAFEWIVLEEVNGVHTQARPPEELAWIRRLGTLNDGTNEPPSAQNLELARKASAELMRRNPEVAEIVRFQAIACRTFGLSEESKERKRQKMVAAMGTPEARAAQSEKVKAHWNKPGVREKASAFQKKFLSNPEEREKRLSALRKYWASPEGQALMKTRAATAIPRPSHAAVMKQLWADPEWREKNLKGRVGSRWDNPEARKIQSEKMKEKWAKRKAANPPSSSDLEVSLEAPGRPVP